MPNIFRQFQALLPRDPLLAGEVISHNTDGTSTVEFPGGGRARPRGQSVPVGDNAYVRSDRIEGPAPDLPVFELTV